MSKPVNVLFVEDSEDDARLALRALVRGGFDVTHRRVQTAAELEAALAQNRWDAVISDFQMPGFTGLDALGICRAAGHDVPFILVSGHIGEETAVAAMKAGASDYIMKDRLARLAPVLEREMNEAQSRAAHRQARRALAESEERARVLAAEQAGILNALPAHIALLDARGRVVSVNEAWRRFASLNALGDPKYGVGLDYPAVCDSAQGGDEAEARAAAAGIRSVLSGAMQSFSLEYPCHSPTAQGWFSMTVTPLADERPNGVVVMHVDITERTKKDERIRRLSRVHAMLSGINGLIVRARGRDELFAEACRIAVEEGGFRLSMIGLVDRGTGRLVPVASAGKDAELVAALVDLWSSKESGPASRAGRAVREKQAVVVNDLRNEPGLLFGREFAACGIRAMAFLPLMIADEATGVIALHTTEAGFFDGDELALLTELADDIAFAIDHIAKQERLDYLAYYDALTGLANRHLFLERVAQYQRGAASGGHKLAVFMIDLERFRNINDSLGRPAGDALLQQVGEWLTRSVGDASLLAKIGADHFAVVLPDARDADAVARMVESTLDALLDHAFHLDDAVLRVGAKIGIAMYPDNGDDAESLLRNAEVALRMAKAGGERYLFCTQRLTERTAGKLTLEHQLRQALDREEFVLHYQPKVSLLSGTITGAEALIRWNDPRTGLVPPGRFIPVLEETGLIHEVGRWALRQAIADYLRWHAAGLSVVRVAVNLSVLQLRHRGFIAEIQDAIKVDARAAPGLELELTESLIMSDVKNSIASLHAIRALGVSIAIDDFGTGFSSLSYLARLPVDTLKIDRSFVTEMTVGPVGLALVSTIISLGHSLRLNVVAEGVETEEQSRLLRLLGCDEFQGFLFSKPVPREILEESFLTTAPDSKGDHDVCRA